MTMDYGPYDYGARVAPPVQHVTQHEVTCEDCGGSGMFIDGSKCKTCNGTGKIVQELTGGEARHRPSANRPAGELDAYLESRHWDPQATSADRQAAIETRSMSKMRSTMVSPANRTLHFTECNAILAALAAGGSPPAGAGEVIYRHVAGRHGWRP
jgi:hypothetical protein